MCDIGTCCNASPTQPVTQRCNCGNGVLIGCTAVVTSKVAVGDSKSQNPVSLQLLYFGFVLCLDSFLFIFTILPLRIFAALIKLAVSAVFRTGCVSVSLL